MISLPEAISRMRHTGRIRVNVREETHPQDRFTNAPAMAELARQIIRQQWPHRNHPDALQRGQARTLIRTHVLLLRKWREAPAIPR